MNEKHLFYQICVLNVTVNSTNQGWQTSPWQLQVHILSFSMLEVAFGSVVPSYCIRREQLIIVCRLIQCM